MWKKTCLVCDSISTATTFTTESYQETFKFQSGPLTCDSDKVLYLLRAFRKGNQKVCQTLFNPHYCLASHGTTEDWGSVIFEHSRHMRN